MSKTDKRPKTWKKALEYYRLLHIQQSSQSNQNDKKDQVLVTGFDDPLGIVSGSGSSDERGHKWREKLWSLEQYVKTEEESEKNTTTMPSIVIYKESFSPSLFLAKVHDKTSYEDLKDRTRAPLNLQRRKAKQEDEIRVLVKNNLEKFIRAKDSLDDIYNTKDSLFTSNSVEKLTHKYQDFQGVGEGLFKPLWARKRNGEDIKNVLTLIQKYELIFSMPDQIKECILSKDYKKVVHDYEKAKYFKKKCSSQIFQKTFTAIDTEIQKLRDNLFKQLSIEEKSDDIDLKLLVDDQEKYIYYLYALDSTVDPAETSLKNLISYIAYLLKSSVKELVPGKMQDVLGGPMPEADAQQPKDVGKRDTQAFKTICKLTGILVKNFPLVHKLAKNILADKYLKKQITNKQKQQENATRKQEMISSLINDFIISTFEKKINQVLAGIDTGSAHQDIYFNSIKECMNGTSEILKLQMPAPFTKRLQEFTSKLKNSYIESTWKRTNHAVSTSFLSEDWNLNEEVGVTQLPLKFRDNILQTISIMSNFVAPRDALVPVITNHFLNCIGSFTDCLHQLAYPEDKPATEEQLLMVLNNVFFTKENVLHKITYQFVDKFIFDSETHYEKEVEAAVFDFLKRPENLQIYCLFDDLEQLLLQSFCQRRSIALIPYFDKGIHLSGYNWKKSSSPDSIRSFVLELLVDLALVHSTVERKAKNYTREIFARLNENVIQMFEQYIRYELDTISVNAAFQLDIEFDFIQKALKKYTSKKSKVKEILKKLKTFIIETSGFDPGDVYERQKMDIINDFSVKTRVQLDCFVNEKENQTQENPRGWNAMRIKLLNLKE